MPTNPATIRAVLFDLDGTLVDTYRLYLEAYGRALEPHLGRRPSAEEIVRRRPASERHFLYTWLDEPDARACRDALQRHYAELHGLLCDGLYDGVREMLAALRSAGLRLGVVTGKGRGTWETTATALDLGAFDVVVTDDDAVRPKPAPDGLLTALATLQLAPAEALYVGDSPTDLEAGRRAGTAVAAALWPKTAPGEAEAFARSVRPFEPEWLFERPADVVRALARWC